ncbi:bifunctional riboflavin biosynthesis protein RIBA 1, chloroplastic-like protein [Tanacetum coccineum]
MAATILFEWLSMQQWLLDLQLHLSHVQSWTEINKKGVTDAVNMDMLRMRRTRKAQLPEKTDDRLQIFSKGTLECPIKDEKKGMWSKIKRYVSDKVGDVGDGTVAVGDFGGIIRGTNKNGCLQPEKAEDGLKDKILRDLGVRTMKLMTNNPTKYNGLKGYGLGVTGRVALLTPVTKHNKNLAR